MAGPFENTGWTKPGHTNLYNICMMEELHPVLALGAGGVSKLVDSKTSRIERLFHPKFPLEYIQAGIRPHATGLINFLEGKI